MNVQRIDGRKFDQIRNLKISYDCFGFSDSSVLLELGKTKVLCCVTLENNVPQFVKGKNEGWITAEYALLPTSTLQRNSRESSSFKRNSRSVEISRLIGRSLRTIVNLTKLGEKTINIDCDVLQADGGTRTACITGSFLALKKAELKWLSQGIINEPILIDEIASISTGIYSGQPLLDLNFEEDKLAEIDFNFVLTKSGKIIEIQGTGEKRPISWNEFEQLKLLAESGVNQIFSSLDDNIAIGKLKDSNVIRT